MTDKERNQELLKLVSENPDLPIVAMVDCDVVEEDSGRWLGYFSRAELGEYATDDERYYDDREDFKAQYYNDNDEELCERFGYCPYVSEYSVEKGLHTAEQLEENEKAEEALVKYLDEVAEKAFVKAIIVYVDACERGEE